jgi:hypothetical protein
MVWLDIFLSLSLPFVAFGLFTLVWKWFIGRAQAKAGSGVYVQDLGTGPSQNFTIPEKQGSRPPAPSFELPGQPGWESALAREEVRLRLKERGL